MVKTLQSYIADVAGPNAGDLQPLAANDTFARRANSELAARDAAVIAAAAENARHDDIVATVQPFSTAMGAIRAIAKRFPEVAKYMDDAAKAVQAAMGGVAYNPQPLPSDTKTPAGSRPFPTVDATGSTPTAPPAPPAPPAPSTPPTTPASFTPRP